MSEEGPRNITPPAPPPGLSAAPPDRKSHARTLACAHVRRAGSGLAGLWQPGAFCGPRGAAARWLGSCPGAPAHCVLALRLHPRPPPAPAPPRPTLGREPCPTSGTSCGSLRALRRPRPGLALESAPGSRCFLSPSFRTPDLAGTPEVSSAWWGWGWGGGGEVPLRHLHGGGGEVPLRHLHGQGVAC